MSDSVYFSVLCQPPPLIIFFSFLAQQVVDPPPAGAFKERPLKPTAFRRYYESGSLPIALAHTNKGNSITWKVGMLSLSKTVPTLCAVLLSFTAIYDLPGFTLRLLRCEDQRCNKASDKC